MIFVGNSHFEESKAIADQGSSTQSLSPSNFHLTVNIYSQICSEIFTSVWGSAPDTVGLAENDKTLILQQQIKIVHLQYTFPTHWAGEPQAIPLIAV